MLLINPFHKGGPEAQRGLVICPVLYSWSGWNQKLNPSSLLLKLGLLTGSLYCLSQKLNLDIFKKLFLWVPISWKLILLGKKLKIKNNISSHLT